MTHRLKTSVLVHMEMEKGMLPKKEKQANEPYKTASEPHRHFLRWIHSQVHGNPHAQDLFRCTAQETRKMG